MRKKVIHLLKPKEWAVWCKPDLQMTFNNFTMYPSKATCGNCLTIMRRMTYKGKKGKGRFKVSHTNREDVWEGKRYGSE